METINKFKGKGIINKMITILEGILEGIWKVLQSDVILTNSSVVKIFAGGQFFHGQIKKQALRGTREAAMDW